MLLDFVLKHLEQEVLKAVAQEQLKRDVDHAVRRALPKAARNIHFTFTSGDIHLDSEAIGKILREDMRKPIDDLAAQIAARVDVGSVTDAPVTVLSTTTDRAIAIVAIAHPAGLAIEAKHGALKKAAASLGYEVKSKGGEK